MSRRRGRILLGLVLVALIAAASWWFLLGRVIDGTATPSAADPVQTVRTTPDPADLSAVTTLLTGLPGGGLDGLTADARAVATKAGSTDVLPAGTRVSMVPGTWADAGAFASVSITVAGPGAPGPRYLATLTRTPAGWRLAGLLPEQP